MFLGARTLLAIEGNVCEQMTLQWALQFEELPNWPDVIMVSAKHFPSERRWWNLEVCPLGGSLPDTRESEKGSVEERMVAKEHGTWLPKTGPASCFLPCDPSLSSAPRGSAPSVKWGWVLASAAYPLGHEHLRKLQELLTKQPVSYCSCQKLMRVRIKLYPIKENCL